MPKPHTFPALYNEMKTVSISFLKKYGYLLPNQIKTGSMTWRIGGEVTGSISIKVDTNHIPSFLELNYTTKETQINYRVSIITVPSNLGKGFVWYFVCPKTNLKCRKLFLFEGYFLHRKAFTGCMYEKQTYSKYARDMLEIFEFIEANQKLKELEATKYFKSKYQGKFTKGYLKALMKVEPNAVVINFIDREIKY